MTILVSWPAQRTEEVETDQELYLLLCAFDADELNRVAVYHGDQVELGTFAMERLHQEYGG